MNFAEFEIVENKLRSLEQGTSLEDRLHTLELLINYLHGPIESGDGYSNEELARWDELPFPLQWWLQFAGRRASIFSHQNYLILPDGEEGMELNDTGRFVFYSENQAVYLWSIFPNGDDPSVWGRFNEEDISWTEEGMLLSEFLIGACLIEGIMQSPYMASRFCQKLCFEKLN